MFFLKYFYMNDIKTHYVIQNPKKTTRFYLIEVDVQY